MADPTQYGYDLKEVTELLVKHSGIEDGSWVLGVDFVIGVGMMGPNPSDVRPGVMTTIQRLTLQKVTGETPANPNAVDAATVNRKSTSAGGVPPSPRRVRAHRQPS